MSKKLERAFVAAVGQDIRILTNQILDIQGTCLEAHAANEWDVFGFFMREGSRFIPGVLSDSEIGLSPDNALATGLEALA